MRKHQKNRNNMSPISSVVDTIQNKARELGAKWRVEYITPTSYSWNEQNKMNQCTVVVYKPFFHYYN